MLYNLMILGMSWILTEMVHSGKEHESNAQTVSIVRIWKYSIFLCLNYVLNGLCDSLWESLDLKYKSDDAKEKMFVINRLLEYKMVDSGIVLSQVDEGTIVSEAFQVEPSIHLLPLGRKDFKKQFYGICFNCGIMGHKWTDCKALKRMNDYSESNVVWVNQNESEIILSAMVTEVNLVGSNQTEWFIDKGATRYMCFNRELFTTFETTNSGNVCMENSAQSTVEGMGKVVLKMTSGKS
ncbi:PREDICTED: uncharacterized protein LOC109178740 [Ipomoea nil]|uniref:uncharacterized protein LOC109178740 n=1 Tax=Ipomoea nil TaxID=35883 RepID=UPI000901E314|nr:PREDICTED: uncharacterized protein LOC109178740 [Ipomoea nil]